MKSTAKQRQLIGFFRKQLKLDSDTYYEILAGYGVDSSKDLRLEDAETLLISLKEKAVEAGVYESKNAKYNNLEARMDMATPKQLRYIEALWKNYSFIQAPIKRRAALENFIYKITGVSALRFLKRSAASLVIRRLEERA